MARGGAGCKSWPPSRKAGDRRRQEASVCPVNPTSKCLECHMPKVPVPTLHRELTDHYIRVHDARKKQEGNVRLKPDLLGSRCSQKAVRKCQAKARPT